MNGKAPLHILIIPAWLQPPDEGHVGVFVREQAQELAHAGISTGIIHVQSGGSTRRYIDGSMYREWHGTMPPAKNRLQQLRYTYYSYFAIYKEYAREYGTPDIIHSHGLTALTAANYLSRRTGIPVIHTEHLRVLMDKGNFYYRLLARLLYTRPQKVIAVSTRLLEALKPITGSKGCYIPNLVHRNYFELTTHRPETWKVARLLTVSDLDQVKGHQLLVAALSLVKQKGILFHWDIIGEGPERSRLEAQIKQTGLEQQISLHGRKSRADILSVLPASTLYISASRLESFGLHIAEAIAAGLFTVTYQSIGAADFQQAANSIVFEQYHPEAAAVAIIEGLQKSKLTTPAGIRNSVRATLHPDIVIAQLKSVYSAVIGKK